MIALEIPDHRAFAITPRSLRNPILSRFSTSSRVDIIAVEIPGHRAFTIAHGSLRNQILSRFSESPAELGWNARCKTLKSCCAVSKHFRHRASIFSKSVPPPIFRIRIASRIRLKQRCKTQTLLRSEQALSQSRIDIFKIISSTDFPNCQPHSVQSRAPRPSNAVAL